jgi:FkbM family methyltransferase
MFLHRFISLIRRGTQLLPKRLSLRALTWMDSVIGATEPENIYIPAIVARERDGVAVDVGANNGVTTEIMAGVFKCVHAFEVNPRLIKTLEGALPENVKLWDVALSSQSGEATLSVPVSKGVVLEGWGSISQPLVVSCDCMETTRVETKTLDSFNFELVDFLKIDVEGHELEVLEGAERTIQQSRPWLVVEALGPNQGKVRAFMAKMGYFETSLMDLSGRAGRPYNLVFTPNKTVGACA